MVDKNRKRKTGRVESEEKFQAIFDNASDGIMIAEIESQKVLFGNSTICRMLGYTLEELRDLHVMDLHSEKDFPYVMSEFQRLAKDNRETAKNIPVKRKDGSIFYAEITTAHLKIDNKLCQAGFFRDITERKADEKRIQRLTQLYAVLSQSNQAIVRCTSEEELFQQICHDAVQFGGMQMAWIGLVDEATKRVKPVASYGTGTNYLDGIQISVDANDPHGRGPTGSSIRENRAFWCENFQHNPETAPWHERGKEMGWNASAALPLLRNGIPVGSLTLYSDTVNAFDEEARQLLVEMAMDISFALDNFAREAERKKAEKQLRMNEAMLSEMSKLAMVGGWEFDPQTGQGSWTPEVARIHDMNPEDTTSLEIGTSFYHGESRQKLEAAISAAISDGTPYDLELEVVTAKGNHKWVRTVARPYMEGGKVVSVSGSIQDITQLKQAEEEIIFRNTILQTQQETSLDSILVVDEMGRIISYNQQFINLWRLSPQLVSAGLDEPVLQSVTEQIEDPEAFVARVQYLYEHHADKSREEILLKDGRIIDRYSAPITGTNGKHYGRVWYFRDITERKQAEQALRASEERIRTMFVQAPLGIALIDSLNGRIYEVNPRFAEIAGRSMEEMANIDWLQITHPDDVQPDLDNMELMNSGKTAGFQMEKRYLHPDGTVVWVDMSISPLKVEDKDHPRHLCMIQDITERKATEARIRYLSRVHAVLSGINTLLVRVQDRNELFREACRVAVEAGGFRMSMLCIVDQHTMKLDPVASAGKDEALLTMIKDRLSSTEDASTTMVGMAIREKQPIVSNDSLNDPRAVFGKQYADAGVRSFVILPLIVSGEVAGTISLYASEIDFFHEDEMKLLTELAGDIAFAIDHLDKQEKLNYLAYYDALTGLANRSLFLERVAQHMRSAAGGGHQLAIGLIDMERFKNINDTLGRQAGDALLKQVSEWLTYKTEDVSLLARIDADHFAIVLPEVRSDGNLAQLTENLLAAFLGHPFRLNDTVLRIGIKVGIALFPDDGADADTLFRNAEAALKKAKASGERYLFYTQKMTSSVAGKLTLENQLRQAIDNEEFVLHYQPKVNLVSGEITSAEALIRWNDPRTGLVPPGRFIPILEETGLIYEVGRWALGQAIADYLRWRSAGLPAVRIAVNVSPLQLRHRDFIAEIEKKIGVDAHAAEGVELEITESLIMEDVRHSITSLQAVRDMGITIAIDDFGTGFSSLSYLAKLPVDTLKIDRAFVIEMTVSPEGLALVSTIIKLAQAMNFKVVAEGVETAEQSNLLRLLGCDEMQGFLFSKAVPAEFFEAEFLGQPPAK